MPVCILIKANAYFVILFVDAINFKKFRKRMYLYTSSFDSNSIWGAFSFRNRFPGPINRSPLLLKGGLHEGTIVQVEPEQERTGFRIAQCLVPVPFYQPYKIASLLSQYGYEPISPFTVKTRSFIDALMGRPKVNCVFLPGILGYLKGLADKHGKSCCVAGLGPSLIVAVIELFVTLSLEQPVEDFIRQLCEFPKLEKNHNQYSTNEVIVYGLKNTIIRSLALLSSYPFIVVGNICILRCIKGEPSVWVWSVVREVWQEAGVTGFYSGLLALLLYDVVNLWCLAPVIEWIRWSSVAKYNALMEPFIMTASSFFISSFTYPLHLVCGLMTANNCSARLTLAIPALPPFPSSQACFKHLYNTGIWFKGSSILLRRLVLTEL